MALVEVCVAATTVGRFAQPGDIICIRKPLGAIGMKEGKNFIWLLMDEADIPQGALDKTDPMRMGIDLEELAEVNPGFELAKCQCPETWYQPFFDTCPRTGKHRDLRERPCQVKVESRLARAVRKAERAKEKMHGKQPDQRG